MKLVYFAWVRERIGRAEEDIDLPTGVETAGDLIAWLRTRGPEYEHALPSDAAIRVAIDQTHARPDSPLGKAREVAVFPPMTGG